MSKLIKQITGIANNGLVCTKWFWLQPLVNRKAERQKGQRKERMKQRNKEIGKRKKDKIKRDIKDKEKKE